MRVLVVEDEHRIANSIKKGLEQESFAVDLAFDGEKGLDLAIGEEYDVIILDLMLPKVGGLQICKNLRKEGIHTPVLILTAKDSIEDKVNGLNCGADDYLPKPFAFIELLARIKALSRRPRNTLDPILTVDKLELDTASFEVKFYGEKINLSKKEYALLEYLVRNKNKVLGKDEIINHVWDYDADILPNTVEVYIGYLRNKLKKANKNRSNIIKTVRGFGYKIEGK